jgi:hypothetical protein
MDQIQHLNTHTTGEELEQRKHENRKHQKHKNVNRGEWKQPPQRHPRRFNKPKTKKTTSRRKRRWCDREGLVHHRSGYLHGEGTVGCEGGVGEEEGAALG